MNNTYVEPTYETIPTVMFRNKHCAIHSGDKNKIHKKDHFSENRTYVAVLLCFQKPISDKSAWAFFGKLPYATLIRYLS